MNEAMPVLLEVFSERTRQDDRWGEQNWEIGGSHMFRGTAANAKDATEQAAQEGTLTWRHILKEEFWEAFAEEDPQAQRAELVQVAAVAVAMIECIDRKARLVPTFTIETQIGNVTRRFTGCTEASTVAEFEDTQRGTSQAEDSRRDRAREAQSARGEEAPPADTPQDVA